MGTTTSTSGGLRVGELAAAAGVGNDTIRFYEREGLLPAPPRTEGGYRSYGPDAVERLRFIRGCRRLGLRLAEIRELLSIRDTGACPCGPAEEVLQRRIDEVDAELARLTELRASMDRMATLLARGECGSPLGEPSWCPPDRERG
ncbi:MAG: heavy metal-responsive transcriptional regulator [Miltoncostaeaceae bacterium]